jgi:hypothetical protein
MCRRNQLLGCCLFAFGLGLILGYGIGSWFWCFWGGIALLFFGLCTIKRR